MKSDVKQGVYQYINIPDNITNYLKTHTGVNLSININSVDGLNGYGHLTLQTVVLSIFTKTCNRCGYDPLWKPNDDNSKCIRHTYGSERYDELFVWSPYKHQFDLEKAFDIWLESQPTQWDKPVKMMTFGQLTPWC